jgi:hypothetical protein
MDRSRQLEVAAITLTAKLTRDLLMSFGWDIEHSIKRADHNGDDASLARLPHSFSDGTSCRLPADLAGR